MLWVPSWTIRAWDKPNFVVKIPSVDDRSKGVGGPQRIETPDGYVFPLSIKSDLVYMHSIQVLLMMIFSNIPMSSTHHLTFGMLLFWTITLHLLFLRKFTKQLMILCSKIPCLMSLGILTSKWYSIWMFSGVDTLQRLRSIHSMPISTRAILLRKIGNHTGLFGGQSEQIIQNTYKVASQFGGTVPQHDYLKKHSKSRNLVFNIPRMNELVATDTVFSDTPAINDESTMG